MQRNAFVRYQFSGDESGSAQPTTRPSAEPFPKQTTTSSSFILVDPSNSNSKGSGRDARSSRAIRKHASKASAAQRLATISEKKRTQNILSKRERRQQEATQRLEAALQQHILKLSSGDGYTGDDEAGSASGFDDGNGASNYTIRHSCGSYETVPSSYENGRQKCSISWLLSPSVAPRTANKDHTLPSEIDNTTDQEDALTYSPSSLLEESLLLNDPLAYSLLDITADTRVRSLLNLFLGSICPLLDVRLPLKTDGSPHTRYAWSMSLPQIMLSSEPLFWAMVLASGTHQAALDQKKPNEIASNIKYRDFAISSVNKRLQAPEKDLYLDLGLVSAIGSLGIWERLCGSKEIWHTHRRGVRMLSERLPKENQGQLLLQQIIAESEASDSLFWADNHTEGFTKARGSVPLDCQLVSAICRCPIGDSEVLDESQHRSLQEQAKAILAWNSGSAMCGSLPGASCDGRSVEMHVLLQGAGISMINFVDKTNTVSGIDQIDFSKLTAEAVELASNVSLVLSYDELLLWASFTIFALNGYSDLTGLKIIAMIARRCLISTWEQMQMFLRTFVYVEAATTTYRKFWSSVESYVRFGS